jgi:hypothetical protein
LGNLSGAKHWVGFKPQAVPGTLETAVTTFMVSEGLDMNANPNPIERKSFIATGVTLPSRLGTIKPAGKAPVEVMASTPQPWYWLLGHVVTTQPDVAYAPAAYLHTITDDALAGSQQNGGQGVNLTCQADRVFDKAKQGDVRISKIKLTATPGEVGRMEIEWMGLTHTDGTSFATTPTFVTDVLTCASVSVKIDGSPDLLVSSVDYECDVAAEQLSTLVSGGAGAPQVIRRKDPVKGSGTLKWIDFPTAQLTKFTAATTFALIVELQGDTIASTYKKFLRLTLPACQYTGGLAPSIGSSVITGDANFASYYDTSTSTQIKVEAQNTIATINT